MNRRRIGLLASIGLALGVSCGDDPVDPGPAPLWREVALPVMAAGGLLSVDARAGRILAIGVSGSDTMPEWLALERGAGGSWMQLPRPAGAPLEVIPLDVALDASGRAVFVGAIRVSGSAVQPWLLDERTGLGFALGGEGTLNAVAFGRGDTARAVGTANGGLAVRSFAPGSWNVDDLGFTTPQEIGLVDLEVSQGVFYACGFNDGAAVSATLLRNRGPRWESLSVANFATIEMHAVRGDPTGAAWLGGGDQAANPPTAFLAGRPTNGDWFQIVLPPGVGTVRDILATSNGDVYLATGTQNAVILRWNGMLWVHELTRHDARILALAESNGLLVAVGVATSAARRSPLPLLFERGL